ncbi:MAG: hypothetical protein C4525_02985 [Desulfarculus sp.]|jgi:hypothetical protein|nr:MAG: hypothetical protein C4525_02985 [Desulfarculus sp.]
MDRRGRPLLSGIPGLLFYEIICADDEEFYVAAESLDEALAIIHQAKPQGIQHVATARLLPHNHIFVRHPADHIDLPSSPVTASQLVRQWGGKGITGNDL